MTSYTERIFALWFRPHESRSAAQAAFAEMYADPVMVNGSPLSIADLVDRSAAVLRAYDDLTVDVLEEVHSDNRVVIAFLMRGRHVGPLETPLGTVAPTGRRVEIRTIDVLTLATGLITEIQVVPDQLGLLLQLDAIALNGVAPAAQGAEG
jgi:SnoaL-like polyketide cyclase